jgi:hypothetical protein
LALTKVKVEEFAMNAISAVLEELKGPAGNSIKISSSPPDLKELMDTLSVQQESTPNMISPNGPGQTAIEIAPSRTIRLM